MDRMWKVLPVNNPILEKVRTFSDEYWEIFLVADMVGTPGKMRREGHDFLTYILDN